MANAIKLFFRRIRRMWNDSLLASSKALTITVLFELLAIAFLAIYDVAAPRAAKCFDKDGSVEKCSIYFAITISLVHILNATFLAVSAIDGIFYDNLYELYAAMFQALFSTALGIFKFVEPYKNDWIDYGFLLVTCACQLIYFAVAYSLRQEYTWRLYRKAGADKAFRVIYKQLLIMKTFSKLDIMFGIINVVSAALFVWSNPVLAAIAWSMLAFHFIFHLIGTYAVNREITRLTMVYFGLFWINPVYIIYMMVYMYRTNSALADPPYSARVISYLFTVTGILDMVVHICLFAFAFITYRNYGRGLKNLEFLKKNKKPEAERDDDDINELEGDIDYVEYAESKNGDDEDWNLFDVIRNTYAIDKNSGIRSPKS